MASHWCVTEHSVCAGWICIHRDTARRNGALNPCSIQLEETAHLAPASVAELQLCGALTPGAVKTPA